MKERRWKETMLIIKSGKKSSNRKTIENWMKEKLPMEEIKVIKQRENKDTAKVIFQRKKERFMYEKGTTTRQGYDMYSDEWLTIDERKEKYLIRKKVSELKRNCKTKVIEMKIRIQNVKIVVRKD